MSDKILLGRGREVIAIPRAHWERHLAAVPEHSNKRLGFMTGAHHRVRYFVVEELPRLGQPIAPEHIAERLDLPLDTVNRILDDLEKNLFFLVRTQPHAVTWAFPVTVEVTPHQLIFSTGETIYAA